MEILTNSMRLTGTIHAKIDAKGRAFLPSDFRSQLAGSEGRLVLKRDIYQPCLVIYPQVVWDAEVDALRARLNRWEPRQAMLFRQFLAEAVTLTLDAAGRILVPKRLLQACGIEHDVSFVGVDDRVELWSAERTAVSFLSPEEYSQGMAEWMGAPL